MRVLVCGGRHYENRVRVYSVLDYIHKPTPITLLIHGAGFGTDILAGQWAAARGVKVYAIPALWDVYGKKAGPIRNQMMIDGGKPEMVVAFPGGRGTADMIARANRVPGIKVTILGPDA